MLGRDVTGSAPSKPLLSVLRGDMPSVPPMWLMRQAGRYLPEYRALRAEKGGFLALATDPEAATEITLQPIRRFGFDGAILFSDILMVPWALGQDLWFEAGEGPRLAPKLTTREAIDALGEPDTAKLQPIYDTCTRVSAGLPPEVTFLGFAGSPWTVATYMIAGQGSKDQAEARTLAYADRGAMAALVDRIVDLTVEYLAQQIAHGVEAVQLFDSWAGSLSPTQYENWVIAPNARIVERLHARCPGTPVIGFPKGSGAKLVDYVAGVRPDAVGLDETVDPAWANAVLPTGLPVQGNLDPIALFAGGAALDAGIDRILDALAGRAHVFNLGHGIGQFTPIDHVQRLIDRVRSRA
ncbi:uroporphyrinogen decarboxylase [Sphingomonas sp. Leaf33]|uniref:uroporphyrinogen decarboxylase n=1 Tax=Sphingomonas sp. Leaf33 TaxID=1736215 RepID=UPI0006FEEE7A|nr:uroporphyrinogen decarboxylase [Sphingomonas sp. Leaf33]KQN24929.1 uroporphyrinogen decarboxylase [Sphingomonas sp. Leaf33]